MYEEGDIADGPNGQTLVYRSGRWVPQNAPSGGVIISDPSAGRDDARKDNAQAMDAARLDLARQAAERDTEAQARQRQKFQQDTTALQARGGVETTEAERTAAFLANRVAGGIQDIGRIGGNTAPSLYEGTAGNIPKIGNYTISEQRQRLNSAQYDVLDAGLTLGTGAAYTKEQIEGYRQAYFPQPGDGKQTIADKQIRLQRLLDSAKIKAGAAAGQVIDRALKASPLFQSTPETSGNDFQPGKVGMDANGLVIDVQGNAPQPPAPTPAPNYGDSVFGQGMSGVNEGIANTLGAPIDLATSAMNLIPRGINALANTNLPTIDNPFLGSQSIKDGLGYVGSILPDNGSQPFARRVGQSLGGAAIPIAGTATTLGRVGAGAVSAFAGGVGGYTANRLFPGNQWADMAGDVLGSAVGGAGMFGAAIRAARRTAEAAVPTIPQLRQQATNLYNQAESRGVVAGPNVTANLAGRVGQIAQDNGLISQTGRVSQAYPRAAESMAMLNDAANGQLDVQQIQVMRETLADAVQATEGKERRIARTMLDAFDGETTPLAPELAQARRVSSRYLSAGTIQNSIDLAEPRAAQFSASGPGNALRTEFRGLDRKIINGDENFNPAVVGAIQRVSRGTPASNAATKLGKLAPTGVVSAGLASGVPFAIGNAIGGPGMGGIASATTMGAGMFGRRLSNRMIANDARQAEMLARNGGALTVPNIIDDDLRRQIAAQLAAQAAPYSRFAN